MKVSAPRWALVHPGSLASGYIDLHERRVRLLTEPGDRSGFWMQILEVFVGNLEFLRIVSVCFILLGWHLNSGCTKKESF